jgi:DNA-binding response OmpR family regulator
VIAKRGDAVAQRTVLVLHVEDDPVQRKLIAHHLAGLTEYRFDVAYADSEDVAVEAFERRGADLVVLDYQLTQGNGLSCLRRLRQRDPLVPIVAISGVATPEMAAELLHAGADEYFDKQRLDGKALAASVRHVLSRTAALRDGTLADAGQNAERVQTLFRQACATFNASIPAQFFQQLDELETAAEKAKLGPKRTQALLESVCAEMEQGAPTRLRAVLLEALVRLLGQPR